MNESAMVGSLRGWKASQDLRKGETSVKVAGAGLGLAVASCARGASFCGSSRDPVGPKGGREVAVRHPSCEGIARNHALCDLARAVHSMGL